MAKGGFDADGKARPVVRFSGLAAAEVTEWNKNLARLDGCQAAGNKDATHLVMAVVQRTPKLLCCLPTVKFVLTPNWIKDSLQHGKLLGIATRPLVFVVPIASISTVTLRVVLSTDEQPYLHKETSAITSPANFNLNKVLAQPNRDQLFKVGRIPFAN